jgi:hypothetical protein
VGVTGRDVDLATGIPRGDFDRFGLGRCGVDDFRFDRYGGGCVYFDRLGRIGGFPGEWSGFAGVRGVFVGVGRPRVDRGNPEAGAGGTRPDGQFGWSR